jgi:hypothetical protein
MEALLASGKMPSEVSKEKWERIKAYAKQNSDVYDLHMLPRTRGEDCALCYKYKATTYSDKCQKCPLNVIDNSCFNTKSLFNDTCHTRTNEEFIIACDKLTEALDKCSMFEKWNAQIDSNNVIFDFSGCIVTVTKSENKFLIILILAHIYF